MSGDDYDEHGSDDAGSDQDDGNVDGMVSNLITENPHCTQDYTIPLCAFDVLQYPIGWFPAQNS